MAETLEAIVEALVVRPGDTLIVRVNCDRRLSREAVEEYRDTLREGLPGVDKVVVIVADGMAVCREGEDG